MEYTFFHIIKRLFYKCYKPLYNNKMGFTELKIKKGNICLIKIAISCVYILTLLNMKKKGGNVLGGGINIS